MPPLVDAAGNLTPSGFSQWAQAFHVFVGLVNLAFVVSFFFLTRRDKRRELELAVDSFWLQKVIVEPHAKALDDLHETFEALLFKAQSSARELHEKGTGGRDEAIASYANTASRHIDKFRFQILPLISVVVDQTQFHSEKPTRKVDRVIDKMDDALTSAIARLFDEPGTTADDAFKTLRSARFDLLQVLFTLHRYPFERQIAWRSPKR